MFEILADLHVSILISSQSKVNLEYLQEKQFLFREL